MTTAAVVIIGGGVMGASVACHLARRGWKDILVIDRAAGPGAGSTGRATGGFRAQYATDINVRLSLLARDELLRFEEETGVDPGFQQAGYLWLAADDAELEVLRAAREVQHAAGLTEAVEVTADEALRLNPALAPDGIVGGAFCPTDGFIRPMSILEGYLALAERLGARIEWDVEMKGFRRDPSGRITGVETTRGTIAAGAVVNAAGAWAVRVADGAGVALPVMALRRQVVPTVPTDVLPASMPMTIFAGDGYHLRVRDGRVLLLWPTPGVKGQPYETAVEDRWIDAVIEKTRARVPALRAVEIDRAAAWGGLYEISPDRHAILGLARECPNLYLINGSSGHGVMHAPALGRLLAEIMTDGAATSLDATPLRASRFAEGCPNPVSGLL